jgi:hypothetical protein
VHFRGSNPVRVELLESRLQNLALG